MKDEIIEIKEVKEVKEVSKPKADPKADELNGKIEIWYLNTFYNKGIPTELFNHFLKSKESLKSSLLELLK